MGIKSRIAVNEKPIILPAIKPPKDLVLNRTVHNPVPPTVQGYGIPFKVARSTKRGPNVAGYVFVGAWQVEHPDEKVLRFFEVSDALGNVNKLYHGTDATNIESICAQGLRPGRATCMFGAGVYMGPIQKAILFATTGWGRRRRRPTPKTLESVHYVLEVEAALGRIKACAASQKFTLDSLKAEGYDSVGGFAGFTASWGGTLRHSEYVVYNPDQVIVNYIYEYHRIEDAVGDPWNGPYRPAQPLSGACQIYRKLRGIDIPKGAATFKDILSCGQCKNTAYTTVEARPVDNPSGKAQNIWVCKACAEQLKLRHGSVVEAVTTTGWGGIPFRKMRVL